MAITELYSNSVNITERTIAAQASRMPAAPMEFRTHETVTATVGSHTITLAKGAPNLLRVDGGQYEVFWSEAGAYGRMVQAIEECAGWDAFFAGKACSKSMSEHWCNGWRGACESAHRKARQADLWQAEEEYIRRGW